MQHQPLAFGVSMPAGQITSALPAGGAGQKVDAVERKLQPEDGDGSEWKHQLAVYRGS